MTTHPIDIIRYPHLKRCATCRHARLISYGPTEPLLAECHLQPNPNDRGHHPYIVMVANAQQCKRHEWRKTTPTIEQRQKNSHAA